MIKIIFLDIDDVLTNEVMWRYKDVNSNHQFDERCVRYLNTLIERTGAVIVISSARRMGTTLTEFRKIFKEEGFKGEIIDVTPICEEDHIIRGNEIYKWLRDNEDIYDETYIDYKNYVILDDEDITLSFQKNNFVKVDRFSGLTPDILNDAINILNKKEINI